MAKAKRSESVTEAISERAIVEEPAIKALEVPVGYSDVLNTNAPLAETWDPAKVQHPRRKVAIVGFTPSRTRAPFDDPEYEIWGLNSLYELADIPRATRWFDLHMFDVITDERWAFYSTWGMPVYLQDKTDRVPTSLRFPRNEIKERFGSDYFTNSIAWMIAFAIYEGFETIEIWGVDMSQDTEYRFQRPGVEHWIGVAQGMGITVNVADTSDLMRATHEYGYGTDDGFRKKMFERLNEFETRMGVFDGEIQTRRDQREQLRAEIESLKLQRAVVEGAHQNTSWMIQSCTVADHTSMTSDAAVMGLPVHNKQPQLAAGDDVIIAAPEPVAAMV